MMGRVETLRGARKALSQSGRSKQARRRDDLSSGESGNAVRWVDNVGDVTRMALALYDVSQARCHGLHSGRSPPEELETRRLTVSESARLI